jgi:hypothetical protein
MSIDAAHNLMTNSVRRSGTQLDVSCSRNAPLLLTEPEGGIPGYKHLTPKRGENYSSFVPAMNASPRQRRVGKGLFLL